MDRVCVCYFAASAATWLIGALAIAAASTGIPNGFAYDDVIIIANDSRLHQLDEVWRAFGRSYWPQEFGGSLYRPLASIGFAIQWSIGGGSPLPFHLFSVALYAAVSVAVYQFARQLFDQRSAVLGAAIFAVHPVHVEAVANTVGQAELGSALLVVLGLLLYVKWARSGGVTPSRVGVICALYAGA